MLLKTPDSYEEKLARKKWTAEVAAVLQEFATEVADADNATAEQMKETLGKVAERSGFGIGKVMPGLRLSVTGRSSGPDMMATLEILGGRNVAKRINLAIDALKTYVDKEEA